MAAALATVASLATAGKRVAVLGDMLELGTEADKLHAELGEQIVAAGIERLLLMGQFAKTIAAAATEAGLPDKAISIVQDHEKAAQLLIAELQAGDLVLLKASRALQFEKIEVALRAGLGRSN